MAGLLAMLAMMRVDYRRLRLVSIPLYAIAVVLLLLVFVPSLGQVVGGSARWLKVGPLPAVHPAEFAKLALVIYLAHWLAKRGTGIGGLLGGTLPFLVIFLPIVALVLREPDLGTSMVLAATGMTMFALAGGNLIHFGVLVAGGFVGIVMFALHGYQLERIRAWIDPWADPGRASATTRSRGCWRSARAACSGSGWARAAGPAGCSCRMPATTSSSRSSARSSGWSGPGSSSSCSSSWPTRASGSRCPRRTRSGALLAAGITTWLCAQAFINIGVVVALFPITGITLPFISAGGSSLTISLAAVGILLSISRETVERGTWNDASADRGRRHGRAHLPGSGRGPIASRQ